MTKLGYRSEKLTYEDVPGKLAPCDTTQVCCCEWLKFFTLYAHLVPEVDGCADEADYQGASTQLQWAPKDGDCDTWEYFTSPALLQCPDDPGPAIDVDHYLWLRCNGDNVFTADLCFDTGVPSTPTTSNCDENFNGNEPLSTTLVCRSPTTTPDPGYLYLDFGVFERGPCPEAGCGWRLIVDTQPAVVTTPSDCVVCDDPGETTPANLEATITGIVNGPCGAACQSLNGTFTVPRHPLALATCIWQKELGFYCSSNWTLTGGFDYFMGSYRFTWWLHGDNDGTVAYGEHTGLGSAPEIDCNSDTWVATASASWVGSTAQCDFSAMRVSWTSA